jgi:hypothetical protein
MFISNNQSLELTIKSDAFTKPINYYKDDLKYHLSAKFLVVQLPEGQNLSDEDLESDKLSFIILETDKRPIGDYTYDADDRIAFNTKSVLKKGFTTYVISLPRIETSIKFETNYKFDKEFGFDFILRKEKSFCCNYDDFDELDDGHQKINPISNFLKTCADIIKFAFCNIYNMLLNTKKASFKMKSNPFVLMELNCIAGNKLSITFPMKEL